MITIDPDLVPTNNSAGTIGVVVDPRLGVRKSIHRAPSSRVPLYNFVSETSPLPPVF
jgi:hypothetical protein